MSGLGHLRAKRWSILTSAFTPKATFRAVKHMSAKGQKATYARVEAMSALTAKADIKLF